MQVDYHVAHCGKCIKVAKTSSECLHVYHSPLWRSILFSLVFFFSFFYLLFYFILLWYIYKYFYYLYIFIWHFTIFLIISGCLLSRSDQQASNLPYQARFTNNQSQTAFQTAHKSNRNDATNKRTMADLFRYCHRSLPRPLQFRWRQKWPLRHQTT